MDPVEMYGTEQEIGARASRIAIGGRARLIASPRDAHARIRLGFDLEAAGFTAPTSSR